MNVINENVSQVADYILNEAISNIAEQLPNDEAKADFINQLDESMLQGINAALNGQDYQSHLRQGTYETSVWLANHYADIALNRVIGKMPRGKNRDIIQNALQLLTHRGIESLCHSDSLDMIKQELSNCAKNQIKNAVANESQHLSSDFMNKLYKNIKFTGKGSRRINCQIKAGTDIATQELNYQIVDNFGAFIDGRKNFGEAVTDVTVNTVKNSAVTWTKGQGAELAAEALKSLTSIAEKKIQNELARNATTTALTKMTNSNAIVQGAGYLIDVGKSLKLLMDGEITKAEFLRIVGEKGTSFIISGAYSAIGATIGTAIGGPIGTWVGGALGSMVGYFATNCLYGAVMQAFEEAEMSRKRYEAIHEFCEYSIREMKKQREEFERKVAEFLSNRQQVIDRSLDDFEQSIKKNDFDGVSAALNGIAEEFGGELQFKTFEEFDNFMSDDDSVFKL